MQYRKKKEFVEVFHLDQIDYEVLKQLTEFCGKVELIMKQDEISICVYYDNGNYIGYYKLTDYLVKDKFNHIVIYKEEEFLSKYEVD